MGKRALFAFAAAPKKLRNGGLMAGNRKSIALVAAIVAAALGTASKAAAQYLRGELCSKLNPSAPAFVGNMILSPDGNTYKIQTEAYGLVQMKTADLEFCKPCADNRPRTNLGVCPGQSDQPLPAAAPAKEAACPRSPAAPAKEITFPRFPSPAQPAADRPWTQCRHRENLKFLGSGTVGRHVLPFLLQAFAETNGFGITRPSQVDAEEDAENKVDLYLLQKPNANPDCLLATVRSLGSESAKSQSKAQIRMTSREFSLDEIAAFAPRINEAPRAEIETVVALDAVAIIASKNNPLNSLTLCEAARLFSDQPEPNRRLNVYFRRGESGTSEFFQNVLSECNYKLTKKRSDYQDYDQLIAAVAKDPDGIGFAPVASNLSSVKTLELKGRCGIGKKPTTFNIKTEDYLLARRLFLYTPEPLDGLSREFMDFLTSDDRADDAMTIRLAPRASGREADEQPATNQKIEVSTSEVHSDSARTPESREDPASTEDFQRMAANAQRLSIVFRFEFGKADLDVRARQDVLRLVRYLSKTQPRQTLLLAGFTDNVDSVAVNKKKALERSEAVLNELERFGVRRFVPDIRIAAYGKVMPIACNDPDNKRGQDKNRRVEVYLVTR
jgi:phosphate transport system substrate-binding protein